MAQVIRKYDWGGNIDYAPIKIYGTYYDPAEFDKEISRRAKEYAQNGNYSGEKWQKFQSSVEAMKKGLMNGTIQMTGDGKFTGAGLNSIWDEDAGRFFYKNLVDNGFKSTHTEPQKYNLMDSFTTYVDNTYGNNWDELDEFNENTGLRGTTNRSTEFKKWLNAEKNKLNSDISYRRKYSYKGTDSDVANWATRHNFTVQDIDNILSALEDNTISDEEKKTLPIGLNLNQFLSTGKDSEYHKNFIANQEAKAKQAKAKQEADWAKTNDFIINWLYSKDNDYGISPSYLTYKGTDYTDFTNLDSEVSKYLTAQRQSRYLKLRNKDNISIGNSTPAFIVDLSDFFVEGNLKNKQLIKVWRNNQNPDDGTFYIYIPEANDYVPVKLTKKDNNYHAIPLIENENEGIKSIKLGELSSMPLHYSNFVLNPDSIPTAQKGAKFKQREIPKPVEQEEPEESKSTLIENRPKKDTDTARLGAAIADLTSTFVGLIPGAHFAGTGIGMGSSLTEFGADIVDLMSDRPGAQGLLSSTGELALNLGMDLVSLIPGGKSVKAVSTLRKLAEFVPHIAGAIQTGMIVVDPSQRKSMSETLTKLNNVDFTNINENDIRNLTFISRSLIGGYKLGKSALNSDKIYTSKGNSDVVTGQAIKDGKVVGEIEANVDHSAYNKKFGFNTNKKTTQAKAVKAQYKSDIEAKVKADVEQSIQKNDGESDVDFKTRKNTEIEKRVEDALKGVDYKVKNYSTLTSKVTFENENLDVPRGNENVLFSDKWFAKNTKLGRRYYDLDRPKTIYKQGGVIRKYQNSGQFNIPNLFDEFTNKHNAWRELEKSIEFPNNTLNRFTNNADNWAKSYSSALQSNSPTPQLGLTKEEYDQLFVGNTTPIITNYDPIKQAKAQGYAEGLAETIRNATIDSQQVTPTPGKDRYTFNPNMPTAYRLASLATNVFGNIAQTRKLIDNYKSFTRQAVQLPYSPVTGDYISLQAGETQSGNIRTAAKNASQSTSDARLGIASELTGNTQAITPAMKAIAADVTARKQSQAISQEIANKNLISAIDVANQNAFESNKAHNYKTQLESQLIGLTAKNTDNFLKEMQLKSDQTDAIIKETEYKRRATDLSKTFEDNLTKYANDNYLAKAKQYLISKGTDIIGMSNSSILDEYFKNNTLAYEEYQNYVNSQKDLFNSQLSNLQLNIYKGKPLLTVEDFLDTDKRENPIYGNPRRILKKGGSVREKAVIQQIKDRNKNKLETKKSNAKSLRDSDKEFNKTYRHLSAGTLALLKKAME